MSKIKDEKHLLEVLKSKLNEDKKCYEQSSGKTDYGLSANYFKGRIEAFEYVINNLEKLINRSSINSNEELENEINELYVYKEFSKLFLDIFELDYDVDNQILTLSVDNKNVIDTNGISIVVVRKEADIIYEMASKLEQDKSE